MPSFLLQSAALSGLWSLPRQYQYKISKHNCQEERIDCINSIPGVFMKKRRLIAGSFITGTLSLTVTGILSRCLGFLIRILLSYTIKEEGMGILQLTMPVLGIGISLCGFGIQSALSRMIAGSIQKQPGQDPFLLRTALLTSLILSGLISAVMYFGADLIAGSFLREPRCASLLRMFSFALPFCCIHSCYNGFFYGHGITRQPAISQLTEQLVRVGTILAVWAVKSAQNDSVSLADAAFATVLSEVSASFYVWSSHIQTRQKAGRRLLSYPQMLQELIRTAAPISGNRLVTTLLMGLENLMLPLCLRKYGLSSADALSLFGVLTGMSMPFILFPSIVTNSMSVLLLPKIASASSDSDKERLLHYSRSSILFSLGLGCLCTAFFYLTGPFLGSLFFHSPLAGSYIRQLSLICPFLYLGVTCGSILNGLGRSGSVFCHTLISYSLRIGAVAFLVPTGGINGYLLGLLTSSLLLCTLHLSSIRHSLSDRQTRNEEA